MKKYKWSIIILLCICIIIVILNIPGNWESFEYSSGYYSDETYLQGGIGTLDLDEHVQYRIRYEVDLREGTVTGELYDSTYDIVKFEEAEKDQILASIKMNKVGTYYMDLPIESSGDYYLNEFADEGSKVSVDTFIETKRSLWRMLYRKIFGDGIGY